MRTEAERQFYLGRAGIHLWYARAPLPGAAPSPEFRFPEEISAPEPVSQPAPIRPPRPRRPRPVDDATGKHRIAGIQALMAGTGQEAPAASEPAKAPEISVPAPEPQIPEEHSPHLSPDEAEPGAQVQLSANLGFWVTRSLVLVSGVSDQASERLQDVLARNILAAIDAPEVEEAFRVRWPVFGNSRVPGNSADDFQGVLRSVSAGFGSRKLLLLGVLTDDLPAGRSEWLAAAIGRPALDFPGSLAELAAVPAYKRELWQQLKSSVGR